MTRRRHYEYLMDEEQIVEPTPQSWSQHYGSDANPLLQRRWQMELVNADQDLGELAQGLQRCGAGTRLKLKVKCEWKNGKPPGSLGSNALDSLRTRQMPTGDAKAQPPPV